MSPKSDPYQRLREMEDNAFVERVVRYLDGEMEIDEFDAFSLELMHDAHKRDAFVALTSLVQCVQRIERSGAIAEDALLESLLGPSEPDAEADIPVGYELADPVETCRLMSPGHMAPQPEEEEAEDSELLFGFAGVQVYQTRKGFGLRHLALAAMVLMAITLGIVLAPELKDMLKPQPPIVAKLLDTQHVQWVEENEPVVENGTLRRGELQAESGFVEVVMDRGAKVIFEAPFQAELEDNNTLMLHRGKLVAYVPTEAYRFTVNTPTAKVVDLGTEFGVEVAENGATRATVFDGKIELYEMTETGSLGRSTTLVAEQQSRVSAQTVLSTVIEPVPTFHLYVRDMRDAVDHVTVTRGHAIYQNHAPASVHRYEDGLLTNQPIIFMEQQRVTVDQTLTRLISEPGWYRGRDMYSRAGRVESGQDVTSYLVHLDIADINGEPYEGNNPQTTHCTLRFPRPIVGLIVGTNALDTSDALFGNPDVIMPTGQHYRGLDTGNGHTDSDEITLSEDRRTITLFMSTTEVDQLRVLTEAPPVETETVE